MFNHDPNKQSVQIGTDGEDHFVMKTVSRLTQTARERCVVLLRHFQGCLNLSPPPLVHELWVYSPFRTLLYVVRSHKNRCWVVHDVCTIPRGVYSCCTIPKEVS